MTVRSLCGGGVSWIVARYLRATSTSALDPRARRRRCANMLGLASGTLRCMDGRETICKASCSERLRVLLPEAKGRLLGNVAGSASWLGGVRSVQDGAVGLSSRM